MAEIKLTPEELLAQSAEFASLQSEYEALFAQVTTVLNGMNENWSENLARNFSGKIQSAQKKFSSVTNMLTNGAAAARMSASTFATPGQILSQLEGMLGIAQDVMQGNADMDTLGKAVKLATGDPLTGNVVQSAVEAALNERLQDNPELMEVVDAKSKQAYDAFKDHDYLSGAGYFTEAYMAQVQNDLGKFGYAFGDTVTNMAGHAAEDMSDASEALYRAAGAVPGDLGDALQTGVKFVGDAQKAAGEWFLDLM